MQEIKQKFRHLLSSAYFLVALGIVPCFYSIYSHYSATKEFNLLKEDAVYLKEKESWNQQKAKLGQKQISQMKHADPEYLEKTIEGMLFLQPEIQKIQALIHSDPNNEALNKRMQFLKGGGNHLHFKQQHFQRVGNMQEMEATQQNSIEMNLEDLKKFLAKIENVHIDEFSPTGNPPLLLIKNFEMVKQPLPFDEEVYRVQTDLIKREILHD